MKVLLRLRLSKSDVGSWSVVVVDCFSQKYLNMMNVNMNKEGRLDENDGALELPDIE